jgi:hypothetical protein
MKDTISRTIKMHTVSYINGYSENGTPKFSEPKKLTLLGEQDEKSIVNEVKKAAGTDLVMVTETVTTEKLYEMPVIEFVAYSTAYAEKNSRDITEADTTK